MLALLFHTSADRLCSAPGTFAGPQRRKDSETLGQLPETGSKQ